MIAILGALLEENDVESRLPMAGLEIPGEYTDMEISRVGVYSAVNYRFFFFCFLVLNRD